MKPAETLQNAFSDLIQQARSDVASKATQAPPKVQNFYEHDLMIVRLAREIAIDHHELDDILERYKISANEWERIKKDSYFQSVLASEIAAWNETTNTHERSKLKAATVIEEWLPEAHQMLHARGESLAARVGLAQLLTRIAGMGAQGIGVEGAATDKFVININLGEREMRVEKTINAVVEDVIVEEEPPVRITNKISTSGGGGVRVPDPLLNPAEIVKKW